MWGGRNIIAVPFAFENGFKSGVALDDNENKVDICLKNVAVACLSAKKFNPDDEVSFITNIPSEALPDEFMKLLSDGQITIREIQFDRFRFSHDYMWSLAFYKLCVLSHLVELDFCHICYLDADVYVQRKFNCIWEEANSKILLYDICDGLNVNSYKTFCEEMNNFMGTDTYPTRYGGEFFAASKELATEFVKTMNEIYSKMIETSFKCTTGDEFIINVAVLNDCKQIKNAGAYVYRFWTGIRFNQISTSYRNPTLAVLHLPAEKDKGMLKLYKRYYSKGRQPSNRVVWRICRLSYIPILDRLIRIIVKIIPKLNNKNKFSL
ncbi:MAG: hypothetical protein LUH18_02605 [Oscillospiraceae bacterium]|nr:hypothetical protein [Oscillospiraceae bacterium]